MKPTEAFHHLLHILSSDKFINKEGVGNEVPFFIYPYDVKDTNEVYRNKVNLIHLLHQRNRIVFEINLYDLLLEFLEKEDDLKYFLENETQLTKKEFSNQIKSILNFNTSFIPFLAEKLEKNKFDILLLTGAGEVYPILRTHKILNNLQSIKNDKPTVLYFPGEYNFDLEKGSNLNLFGRQIGDQYYRAFNLLKYNI
jgi:hypothetical protein